VWDVAATAITRKRDLGDRCRFFVEAKRKFRNKVGIEMPFILRLKQVLIVGDGGYAGESSKIVVWDAGNLFGRGWARTL
jgi:hypothetical protein